MCSCNYWSQLEELSASGGGIYTAGRGQPQIFGAHQGKEEPYNAREHGSGFWFWMVVLRCSPAVHHSKPSVADWEDSLSCPACFKGISALNYSAMGSSSPQLGLDQMGSTSSVGIRLNERNSALTSEKLETIADFEKWLLCISLIDSFFIQV